jgi:hypothetical protein
MDYKEIWPSIAIKSTKNKMMKNVIKRSNLVEIHVN